MDPLSPSAELALSLTSPNPAEKEGPEERLPSTLPPATMRERTEVYDAGGLISVQARWFQNREAGDSHLLLHRVEVQVEEESIPISRGQLEPLRRALALAEAIFDAEEREMLGRNTC